MTDFLRDCLLDPQKVLDAFEGMGPLEGEDLLMVVQAYEVLKAAAS